jgi:hypothetical protein
MMVLVSLLIILLHLVQRQASAMTSTVRVDAQWAHVAKNMACPQWAAQPTFFISAMFCTCPHAHVCIPRGLGIVSYAT